jgi:hypothetical protein
MRKLLAPAAVGALLTLGLAACETRRPVAETAAPPASAPAIPPGSVAGAPDSAAFSPRPSAPHPAVTTHPAPVARAYRRYVGTVGTAPLVLVLAVADSVQGSYYYPRRGGLLTLSVAHSAAGQPLTLRETDAGRLTGRWQTRQPLGPVLSGTWHSPDGRRQLPFRLREDYSGAVSYAIETYSSEGEPTDCGLGDGQTHVTSETRDVVYLPPPVTAAVARVQRQLLPAPHAQLQRHLDRQVRNSGECAATVESARVMYNADFLLSIEWFEHTYAFGTPHPTGYYRHRTFDLRTGRLLALAALLRPRFELPLRRLLSAHLRADSDYWDSYGDEIENDSTQTRWPPGPDGRPLAPLPQSGYYLTPAGIGFQYDMYEIAMYVHGPVLVEISYQEMQPLVRPGSPLAALLRERGLLAARPAGQIGNTGK